MAWAVFFTPEYSPEEESPNMIPTKMVFSGSGIYIEYGDGEPYDDIPMGVHFFGKKTNWATLASPIITGTNKLALENTSNSVMVFLLAYGDLVYPMQNGVVP